MKTETAENHSQARERVLDAADKLFAERGYAAVTLRDIAAEVGIRHTSLYHHVPGGKEELFIEVTERSLTHHRIGLSEAIVQAGTTIRPQLFAAADWFLSHPPMDLVRMTYSDMPEIEPREAHRISQMAFDALILPVHYALEGANQRGEIAHDDVGLIAGGLVGMIESLHSIPEFVFKGDAVPRKTRKEMAYDLIDVMLRGLEKRELEKHS